MKKKVVAISLMVWASLSHAASLELQSGVAVTDANLIELVQTSLPLSVARSGQRSHDDPVVSAFLFDEVNSQVYSLSDSNHIYLTKYPDRNLLGHWLLTRWPHDYLPPLVEERYTDHGYAGSDSEGTFQLPLEASTNTGFGCLAQTPLRYGDVFGGTRKDLVLWLGYNFVIFSPEQGETLFSQRISIDDWLDRERTDAFIEYVPGGVQSDQPQYQSAIIAQTTANYQAPVPGYRGYAKLYFGSFSGENSRDILVWNKLYESRRKSDDVQGFRKLEDVYRHVKLHENDDGAVEYALEETEPAIIQGWLTANALAWSDGYPSASECPGEEGQLIAEMHDPLLNDPEVLPPAPTP